MTKKSRQAADSGWKQLLRLGEQLVQQPDPQAQCELIAQTAADLFAAQARVWLASPVYPLPGQSCYATLPEAEAPAFVQQAAASRTKQQQMSDQAPGGCCKIAVPLIVNDDLLGVAYLERPDGSPFSDSDLEHFHILLAHAALAMEATRQVALKNWRNRQLSLVSSVSAQIANLTSLSSLYSRVSELIQQTFDFYYVAIFTLDEQQGVLRYRGSATRDPSVAMRPDFSVALGQGIVGTVAESGTEIVAPDVQNESRYMYVDLLPETRSEAALPLKVENRILGVLDVQSDLPNSFHEIDMLTLRVLADNVALALESTRLYDDLQQRAEQISSVFEVGHALTSILDLDELLNQIVQLIQKRFGYPFVHLYTVHLGRRIVQYRAGTGERSEAMKKLEQNYSLDAPRGLIPWVARNGRTYVANDVTQDPLYLPTDVPPYDTRSELSVPLIAGDEVLGVLDIQSREPNAFDDSDRALFEALAAPVAVAMRNASLYRSEQWRRKVAESFRDVANLITANHPLNELLDMILAKLEDVLPCDAAAIWLLHEEAGNNGQRGGSHLRLAATRNVELDNIFEALQSQTALGMLERALEAGEPLIRRETDPIGPLGEAMGFERGYSSIAAPMRTSEGPLGMITMVHHQNGRYGSEAQAITSTFASYAAVAIQNARLYTEAQEQALISTMLLQVSEASQSTMVIDDLLATMVRLARLLMGVKKCAFLLWEDGLQSYTLKAWYGFEPQFEAGNPNARTFAPTLSGLQHLAEERSIVYLDDPGFELDLPEMRLTPGTVIMLPMLVRGELIGAFLVGLQMASQTGVEPGFDPKALAILQGIAQQTSLTIDNLRLLEARQEEAYVTAALLQVAQAVVTSNDLNDTLDTIVHLMPILVGVETCVIYLWDASNQLLRPTQVAAQSRREEETIRARPFAPGENKLLDAIRTSGTPYMCAIPDAEMPFEEWSLLDCQPYEQDSHVIDPNQTDWVIGYPLTLQGQVFGVLTVREMNASPSFWDRRLEIINGIAQQASLAIQNDLIRQELVQTERIEREIQLARQIQETFLPESLPQIPGWELDLRWETAREIGGDFYDIVKLDENRIGLVIADVADKGLPAALYMTVSRTLIRASAAANASPAKVLEEVNSLLLNDSSESMFVTAVYAILSLDSGKLTYANAGHSRPLLYRFRGGKVEQLPKGGTALGILETLHLEEHHITIRPGDALILFTDGVTDIQSPEGQFFGEQRLMEIIQQHGKGSVVNMLEELDDEMIEFRRGTPPADDVTLLAIRRERGKQKARRAGEGPGRAAD